MKPCRRGGGMYCKGREDEKSISIKMLFTPGGDSGNLQEEATMKFFPARLSEILNMSFSIIFHIRKKLYAIFLDFHKSIFSLSL